MQRRQVMSVLAAGMGASLLGSALPAQAAGHLTKKTGNGIPFYLFDAFTASPFSGNPAPVVVLQSWLPDSVMQAFASEMNQSEVAYILKDSQGWHIRWFTPVKEVPLNGHATLAAAALIFNRLEPHLQQLTFATNSSGPLGVVRHGDDFLMDFPADDAPVQQDIPAQIEADLGVKPTEFWANKRNILVFNNADEVRAIQSRLTKDTAWTNGKHVMVTAPGSAGVDYVLRYFAPLLNIPEDPVTGVVHCTLVPFWAKRLGKTQFSVMQLSSRGGKVATGLQANGRVLIGGPCALYAEGQLHVPV